MKEILLKLKSDISYNKRKGMGAILNRKKKSTKRESKDNLELMIMCLPLMLLLFLFNYLPMFGVVLAFKQYNVTKGIWGSDWIGFKNFQYFLNSQDMARITYNTLFMNSIFIIFGTIASLFFALLLYEITSKKALKLYNSSMVLPNFISWVVVGFMSYALLNPTIGVVNKLIEGMGFSPVEWYQKPKVWPTIITLFYIWKIAGVNCIIYYAGLMGIDKAYFEAATLDGASKIQIVFKIMLPFISTIITMMVLLQIGNIFRADFGMFYNLTRDVGALYPTTDVIDTYIFRALRVFGDVGTSSAVGLFQSVVGFVLVVITNWVVKKKDSDAALF